MGMTNDDCIHKLDFLIGGYQRLIDENVSNGVVVGTGVRGTWTASTPPIEAYLDMIEALQMAKETMRKYQTMQEVLEKVWNVPSCMLDEAECLNKIMETYRTVR